MVQVNFFVAALSLSWIIHNPYMFAWKGNVTDTGSFQWCYLSLFLAHPSPAPASATEPDFQLRRLIAPRWMGRSKRKRGKEKEEEEDSWIKQPPPQNSHLFWRRINNGEERTRGNRSSKGNNGIVFCCKRGSSTQGTFMAFASTRKFSE